MPSSCPYCGDLVAVHDRERATMKCPWCDREVLITMRKDSHSNLTYADLHPIKQARPEEMLERPAWDSEMY